MDKNSFHRESESNWVAPVVLSPDHQTPSKLKTSRSSFEQMAMRPPIKAEDLPWVAGNLDSVDLTSTPGSTTDFSTAHAIREETGSDNEATESDEDAAAHADNTDHQK